MDLQTAKDYIDDLKIERALLLAEIDQLRDALHQMKKDLALSSESEQRYASDYFRMRRVVERLIGQLQGLEAERDQWQRQAMQHG